MKARPSVDELRSLLDYDPKTGVLTWRYRPRERPTWNTRYAGTPAGTLKKREIQVKIGARLYRAHQLAWAIHTGEWAPGKIDHRDSDFTNNAILNLRPATTAQNNSNRRVVAGVVGYKGVYYCRRHARYAAQIKAELKWSWLGLHDTAEAAARAYDVAAIELHGEFAVTNASLGLLT
jgi:hypothetical protein